MNLKLYSLLPLFLQAMNSKFLSWEQFLHLNYSHWRKHTDPSPDDEECVDPKSLPPYQRPKDGQLLASFVHCTPTTFDSGSEKERHLKQDPLALVLSPSLVECRQCNKTIKLSSKTSYDPYHWDNHRARCIKAHKAILKAKATRKTSASKKYLTHPGSLSSRLLSLDKCSPMHTPPLISDREDDRVSDHFAGGKHAITPTPSTKSFSPSPKQLQFTYPSLDTTGMFSDYLHRCHPDYVQPAATSFQPARRWQDWSWSQLQQPRFPVGDDHHLDNYDDNVRNGAPDIFHWTAASSRPFSKRFF